MVHGPLEKPRVLAGVLGEMLGLFFINYLPFGHCLEECIVELAKPEFLFWGRSLVILTWSTAQMNSGHFKWVPMPSNLSLNMFSYVNGRNEIKTSF